MARDPLRIGIIGFGRIGAEHRAWLARCDDLRATAVSDVTPARRALAASMGLRAYETHGAMLAEADIDAVLVASPSSMHFEHASAALRAGKHVMVEKPIATNLPQARALDDLASKHGQVLSVFHNRRWDPDYLAIQSAIATGVFGKIINIESRLGQWSSCVGPAAREYRPNWRNESAFGGGGLFDWGSHFIDQIWQLLLPARPLRVFAQLRHNVWSSDCDDFARVCIDFDNGAVGLVEINTTTTQPLPRWHIDGTAGSAHSPFSLEFDVERWADLEFVSPGSRPVPLPRAKPGLSEADIWSQFARAVREGTPPAVSLDSVLTTMALLDAARQSSASGQSVSQSAEA